MLKITMDNLEQVTVAFLPQGFVEPVIYEVASTFVEKWMRNLLRDDDISLRRSCLSGVYLFSIKIPGTEPFNGFATHLFLFGDTDPICGNCFAVRLNVDGKVSGLTEKDVENITRISYEYFKARRDPDEY